MVDRVENDQEEAYFASVAADYDRLQPVVAGPAYDRGLAMVVDLLPFDADDRFRFVELGCGTAEPTVRVLERFPHAKAVCIDGEPAMLEIARKKLQSRGGQHETRIGDITQCDIPQCEVVISSKAFHHISPDNVPQVLHRIADALVDGGCFILLDHMAAGPRWGKNVVQQSRRIYGNHVRKAIAGGGTTQEEVDARWAFKKKMKAAGKDVEYRHTSDALLSAMTEAGFEEVGLVWRMFADTILVGFTPHQEQTSVEQGAQPE